MSPPALQAAKWSVLAGPALAFSRAKLHASGELLQRPNYWKSLAHDKMQEHFTGNEGDARLRCAAANQQRGGPAEQGGGLSPHAAVPRRPPSVTLKTGVGAWTPISSYQAAHLRVFSKLSPVAAAAAAGGTTARASSSGHPPSACSPPWMPTLPARPSACTACW